MRSLPLLLGALCLILWTSTTAYAQGIIIEGEGAYSRTNTENVDLEQVRTRGLFVQKAKLSTLKLPLLFGVEIDAFEQKLTKEKGAKFEVYETKNAVINGLFGFEISNKKEAGFSWQQLFGISLQHSEAFDENFFLAGASLQSKMEIEINRTKLYQSQFFLDLRAAGRLGTDSSHASGRARLGVELSFKKPFLIVLGTAARAQFFIENLGLNSALEKFIVQVDVGLVGAEVYLQLWHFRFSGYYSPQFAGRYTAQSHLGVINNGPADHFELRGGLYRRF